MTPSGALATLYNFCSLPTCTDGYGPFGGLVQGPEGDFYGTTAQGGAAFPGTVFRISPSGTLTTLHSFCSETNCTDGSVAYDGLLLGSDGNFYGTTWAGGLNDSGTIFRITPGGALTVLYSFCSVAACADGKYPMGGLTEGADGNLYGTTSEGGSADLGTVFKLATGLVPATFTNICSPVLSGIVQ